LDVENYIFYQHIRNVLQQSESIKKHSTNCRFYAKIEISDHVFRQSLNPNYTHFGIHPKWLNLIFL